jgi:NAD(P)H-nitrite reductase large subunit
MAGARLVEDILARGGRELFDICMFGDEPYGNYNRILLSSVLSGTHDPKDIFINPLGWYEANDITLHAGVCVERIDREAKKLYGADGMVEAYDKLVIATGSTPFIPPCDGLEAEEGTGYKNGVFVFRTLDDCDSIIKYAKRARVAAVIGGGLLGLEAARGLLNLGVETHVIHLMSHLMEVQLDAQAGAVLRGTLEKMGVRIHLEKSTSVILGNGRVTGLGFKDDSTLECDMVVISAGIRPNVKLAQDAGLTVERGIVVEDDLRCVGEPDIYAVGECAQHRGLVYGLVAPLWEQTKVLADRLTGRNPKALYRGSRVSTKLKVMGVELAVMGEKEPTLSEDEVVTYTESARGIYKKLVVREGRLAGAILLGDGGTAPSLLQSFQRKALISDNRAELLFSSPSESRSATTVEIPDTEQICNCNNVSKGEIVAAVKAGCVNVDAVCEATRAGTGCGSCRPDVESILRDCGVRIAECGLGDQNHVVRTEFLVGGPQSAAPSSLNVGLPRSRAPLNKIEELKSIKDGLDVLDDIPVYAQNGWEAIPETERERLKWAGIFFRKQTPGSFMMRLRSPNGMMNAAQFRTIAEISEDFGKGFVDLTTRQQVQLRWFKIDDVPEVWKRLEAVGLVSLQTGIDNVRGIVGCPAAGLTPNELFDASPAAKDFNRMLVGNREFTNLPRKFNVTITGCLENCTHAETQDIALTPAVRSFDGDDVKGFNVAVGGKLGSGGYRAASALNAFVPPEEAAELCRHITLIFRDHGLREARNKARLAFLIEHWGVQKFRQELERRLGRPLLSAGRDARIVKKTAHTGAFRQKQRGLNYVGLTVPVGRIKTEQLFGVARLAEAYGNGDIRLTVNQDLIIPNVPDAKMRDLIAEPLLKELRYDASEVMRGLVSCTGIDYCHMALIETKELAIKTSRHLEEKLGQTRPVSIHWSGCIAGCGNHSVADIGLLGKRVRVEGGEIVDAVDVFVGGKAGPQAKPPQKLLENVHCDDLPEVLERIVPYLQR